MPRSRAALRSVLAASALVATLSVTGCSLFGGGPERDDAGNVTKAASLGIDDLQIGDCFNTSVSGKTASSEDTEVETNVKVVPCTEAHTDEVFAKGKLTGTTLPSGSELEDQAAAICDEALAKYVGDDNTDVLYAYYTANDNISYATNKTLTCAIALEDGSAMNRTAKGVKTLEALTAK